MVRAGQDAFLFDEFMRKGIVAIGWNELGQLSEETSLDLLKQNLREAYPDSSDGKIFQSAGQIWRFIHTMQCGDKVVTYDPDDRTYEYGEIQSDYIYDTSLTFHHARKVEWHDAPIPRDMLHLSTKNTLGSIMTIFELSEEVWEDLYKNAADHVDENEYLGLFDDYNNTLIEEGQSRSKEFIKDKVAELDWEDLEKLVAGILRGMGYKTQQSGKGPDTGFDILASPDGLGMEEPRIKVEVKKRSESKIGAPQIRSFAGGLRANEKGLYVSTGGFSKDANLESERANFSITLVDLELLTKLLTDYYENLDAETKALVPLTRIYWPI